MQAKHNESFSQSLTKQFPDDFFDWKITAVFYTTVHYVDAYLVSHEVHVSDHTARNYQLRYGAGAPYSFNEEESIRYHELYRISITTRYNAFRDKSSWESQLKKELKDSIDHLKIIKKYILDDLEEVMDEA